MKTTYAILLSQLYHPLHLPDLCSSRVFLSLPSILPSSIILVISVYYLYIIIMKKLMNLDHLAFCCRCTYFISVSSLSVRIEPNFNSICIVCKSFSRISWPIKDKQLINIEHLTRCCGCACFVFICFCWQLDFELGSTTKLFDSIYIVCKSFSKILWPTKDKQLIKIERLARYCSRSYACFISVCFYWQFELMSITNLFDLICTICKSFSKIS